MKIIKRPNNRITCIYCGTEYEYDLEDIQHYDKEYRDDDYNVEYSIHETYVLCPVCKHKKVLLRKEYK